MLLLESIKSSANAIPSSHIAILVALLLLNNLIDMYLENGRSVKQNVFCLFTSFTISLKHVIAVLAVLSLSGAFLNGIGVPFLCVVLLCLCHKINQLHSLCHSASLLI